MLVSGKGGIRTLELYLGHESEGPAGWWPSFSNAEQTPLTAATSRETQWRGVAGAQSAAAGVSVQARCTISPWPVGRSAHLPIGSASRCKGLILLTPYLPWDLYSYLDHGCLHKRLPVARQPDATGKLFRNAEVWSPVDSSLFCHGEPNKE